MNSENCHFYCVTVRVVPKPAHPLYYDLQFAFLNVWLCSREQPIEAPQEVAMAIVEHLPYELVADDVLVRDGATTMIPGAEDARAAAGNVGLAITLFACPTGADEDAFRSTPI